jgi:hypothetical protein
MVGQAAKAADMRAGNVPKPGMKAMNGGGGSMSRSTSKYVAPSVEKPKPKPKPTSHSQLAMQWEANGRDANGKVIKFVEKKQGWSKEEINRARDRAAEERRGCAEAAAVKVTAAADAGEEVEPVAEGELAHVLARARMTELARELQRLEVADAENTAGSGSADDADETSDLSQLWDAVERRRSQLEEIECLEAMFAEEFLLISSSDAVGALRQACESLQGDGAASSDLARLLREVAVHPPLEFSLQLTANGMREAGAKAAGATEPDAGEPAAEVGGAAGGSGAQVALVASILLRVRFPLSYPRSRPAFSVEDAMVTTEEPLAADKVLTSVAILRDDDFVAAMLDRAAETLPDPCVFEVVSWVTENVFEFVGQAWV